MQTKDVITRKRMGDGNLSIDMLCSTKDAFGILKNM